MQISSDERLTFFDHPHSWPSISGEYHSKTLYPMWEDGHIACKWGVWQVHCPSENTYLHARFQVSGDAPNDPEVRHRYRRQALKELYDLFLDAFIAAEKDEYTSMFFDSGCRP